jgi:hypothetical protein
MCLRANSEAMLANAAHLRKPEISFWLIELQSRTPENAIQATAGCIAGVDSGCGFGGADKMLRSSAITAVILVLETGT